MWPLIFSVIIFAQTAYSETVVAKIATILPKDEKRLFSISKISIAIEFALNELKSYDFRDRNITFNVSYADSKCADAQGMNEAIKMYMHNMVDVFFGPNCDYSVAPVARQVTFWNLPLISGGAMARDFKINKRLEYPLLTRVGPADFNTLSNFIVDFFGVMKWNNPYIIYDRMEQKGVLEEFCNLFTNSLHYNANYDYYKMEHPFNYRKILTEVIGNTYAGKEKGEVSSMAGLTLYNNDRYNVNSTIDITEILLKVALNTIRPN